MPRYFFHTEDGGTYRDDDGIDLANDAAAGTEALQVLGEMLRDAPGWFWTGRGLKLTVTDACGQAALTLEVTGTRRSATVRQLFPDGPPRPRP